MRAAGIAVLQRHLEVFAPRIRDPVDGIGDPPAAARRASTRRASTADCSSRTANFTRRACRRLRAADCISTTGGVLSMSKLTLSSSPTSAVAGGVRRRVGRGDLHVVGAVGHRRRVPDDDRVPQAALERLPRGFPFAAIEDVELQAIVVVVVGLPDEASAAPSGRPCGRAPAPAADELAPDGRRACCCGLRPSDVFSSKPAISSSPVENGRWNTVPGGCTVMLVTSGRRLRGR